MDDTVRTLAEIDATAAKVVFRSCSADYFTYTVECDSSTVAIPSLTQSVTLFRDGVKFFSGVVTDRSQQQDRVTVVVSGPWWQLDNMVLEVNQADGTGAVAPRPSLPVGGSFKAIIETVINYAIAAGAPIALGTVSTYFDVPANTYNQSTYGQVLAELLRLVPDGMAWFDYSTTNPTLNVTRRGVATTRTIDITDCAEFEAKPRIQLKLNYLKIHYTDRAPNGRRRWQSQTAGTPAIGFNGITMVSGPEMDTFLPDEPTDSVFISSFPTSGSPATLRAFLNATDSVLTQLISRYTNNWFNYPGAVPYFQTQSPEVGGASIPYHTSTPSASSIPAQQGTIGPVFKVNGVAISGTKYVVDSSAALPDWLTSENGIAVYDAILDVDIPVIVDYSETTSYGKGFPTSSLPGVVEFAGYCWRNEPQLFNVYGSPYPKRGIFIYKATANVKLLDNQIVGTIYRRPSFTYRAPPANFASNLLASQNWTPYDGRFTMPLDESGGTRYRGCKIRVTNSRITAHATMDALVESEELDLMNDMTTVILGAPPRVDYQTWVDKSRTTPQANIIYL
ncbi:hypothetical protein [Luteolibacter soli]|uniref:Minor tail protein n=1 Tax=Luteolibacter soli TaxID=3135280 RepID=A0ABU9AS29_9BACT